MYKWNYDVGFEQTNVSRYHARFKFENDRFGCFKLADRRVLR